VIIQSDASRRAKGTNMTEKTPGGFTGDPAAALAVTSTSGCCGNTAAATAPPVAASVDPCCGEDRGGHRRSELLRMTPAAAPAGLLAAVGATDTKLSSLIGDKR
jgi:hypothetical protein